MRLLTVVASAALISGDLTGQPNVQRYPRTARAPAQWSVGPRPQREIGGSDGTGPLAFSEIVGVTRQADGSIVVADGSTRELRFFDRNGRHIRNATRKGLGPGEIEFLTSFTTVADTLVVADGRRAVHVYAPNGTWLRSLILPPVPRFIVNPVIGALTADDMVQNLTAGHIDSMGTVRRDSIWLGRLSLRDTSVRVIAAQPRTPTYAARQGVPPTVSLVFTPRPLTAIRDGRVCLGYPTDYTITCVDSVGRAVFEIRRDVPPRAVTEAAKTAWRQRARTSNRNIRGSGLQRPVNERALAEARFAATFPAYAQLHLSRTGDLWVRQHPTDGSSIIGPIVQPSDWSIYDREGRWIADCRLPARFALFEAGADYVVGVTRDDDDVERVTLLSLIR